jgi:hypothetical protein
MGRMRNLEIETFQRKARIHIPDPTTIRAWQELQQQAFQVIKIAELEISGIRDGDGCWGGDVIGGTLRDLECIVSRLMQINEMRPSGVDIADSEDELPF